MSSDNATFEIHVEGSSSFYNTSLDQNESLPASNDSWILKLKPQVSMEKVASTYLVDTFDKMNAWKSETRQDAFARMLFASFSKSGPSPNLFFPDLGVFAQDIAIHSIIFDQHGHYAYGQEV